ncbi:hypothetical protein PR202_gb22750 [Eleusine coracana subsp. coracana]|uniref:Homeobox-leucine zipper protein n=1 Tax=Eleusine coracana subsp. coracana TaxID=191504 RepID=A0AAV5FEG9_ELECO|nr:hypothetical protein QOZ80_6AG0534040 [Eleusine coracana subsp. coracana]GJN34109.1 hypothetical protein PR202_gb22750 [Eleusine coracana subsp. coracana]
MESGRLINSGVPFRARGGSGGQMLLFGGGSHGGVLMAAAENGRRNKRPFSTAQEELHQLELGLDMMDDVDQLCGFEYELHGAPSSERMTKRRLTAEQVRALEVSFEEEKRKLEPERKTELARRLGIAPRQVAVWFQNRRARWRAKQLVQDFDRLRAAHDELLAGRDKLLADNDRLRSQVITLTEKLQGKEPPVSQPEEQSVPSAATYTTTIQTAVLVVQLDEDQLRESTGCAVPVQEFAEGANSDSPESYLAGAPSPPSSSEGDCGDEGSALLLPDAMLLAAVEQRPGHDAEEDSWKWFWN